MRLRLTVQRHALPASNILWTVPDTASSQAYTVARLLEDVNRILPLEAEHWGLEDYIVEVAGFECLHFSPVLQTLKEDDHVSIRPLLTAEVRSRTLCGRNQISADGRHLVDGIPFGRPLLRQPHRPPVGIPPRKRPRLGEDTMEDVESPESTGYITAPGDVLSPVNGSRSNKNKKEVQFAQSDGKDLDESDEDEDFVPGHVSEGSVDSNSDSSSSVTSESSSSVTSEGSSSVTSEASAQPTETNSRRHLAKQHSNLDSSSASEGGSSSASSSSNSDSDSDTDSESDSESRTQDEIDSVLHSDSDASSPPEVLSSKPTARPFLGSACTRKRNFRRSKTKLLNKLKAEGKLHPGASYTDLDEYMLMAVESPPEPADDIPAKTMAKPIGKRKRLDEEPEGPDAQVAMDESAELERRKQELIARLEGDMPDIEMTAVESSNATLEHAEESPRASAPPATTTGSGSKRASPAPTPPAKRVRPNVVAIGRILQRQAVNPERKRKATKASAGEECPEPEGASDPDFWKSRIKLSAFECWDQEFEERDLSAPPFPFKQHWDPASKIMRENEDMRKKTRNRKRRTVPLVDDNEGEQELETPILGYDDSPGTMKAGSDPTDAIESQLHRDIELAVKPDLPCPPENVESLPDLQPSDIKLGAIVVFKSWIIDPTTVTPEISDYRTAIVEKAGDSGNGAGTFRLKLAERDVPKKVEPKRDRKGNTMNDAASGFRMEEDEEGEDEGVWEGMFAELLAPKLLRAAD